MDVKPLHPAQRAGEELHRCFVCVGSVRVYSSESESSTPSQIAACHHQLSWSDSVTYIDTHITGPAIEAKLMHRERERERRRGERFTLTRCNPMLQIRSVRSSSLSRDIRYSVIIPVFWQIPVSNGLRGGCGLKKKREKSFTSVCVTYIYSA